METLKYIVKRLLLAVLILLGVSVIIYTLARIMPTDYIDQTYASKVSQGQISQADVDHLKEAYGLAMPDAYLTISMGEGSEFAGKKFETNTKVDTYSEVVSGGRTYKAWYTDNSSNTNNTKMCYEDGHGIRLTLWYNGKYEIGKVLSRDVVSPEDIEDEDVSFELDVVVIVSERGTWELVGDVDENNKYVDLSSIRQIKFTKSDNTKIDGYVKYRAAKGTDKAAAILKGYFKWLGNLLKGDLGISFKYKRPVADVIVENMGISFGIAFVATILQFVIAIPLGIKAAVNQYGVIDYTVTILVMMGISLPTFFLGAIFIKIFGVELHWIDPSGGLHGSWGAETTTIFKIGDVIGHLIVPMIVLVILSIGGLMRYTRTNTLEALNADYVRTARAKGLSERTVIYKHAFRNTMIPLVTLMAGILPSLFGGAMITETVFNINGIGKLAYDALAQADVPFIMGYNMFIAILTVLGTLLSDLMYAVVDPRVKLGK